MDAAITFTVDGERVELRFGELDARTVRRVRQESGLSPMQAFRLLASGESDLDVVASLFYAAKLQAGERVSFDELADRVSYDGFEVGDADDDLDVDNPEI